MLCLMPTETQRGQLYKKLRSYKKKYLIKRYSNLDESATRLMVNSFLTEVLGYTELDEIKTEYTIKGTYADYVIQVDRKKHFIVEVKAIELDLSEKHTGQAINYAANEGIDWVLLTNGKQMELYKVLFGKPIDSKKIFSFDLSDMHQLKESVDLLVYLTKKSILKKELDHFWARFQALEPNNLHKYLYSEDVIRFLRRALKKKTGLAFSEEDILDSVYRIVIKKINSVKPKAPLTLEKKQRKLKIKETQEVEKERAAAVPVPTLKEGIS